MSKSGKRDSREVLNSFIDGFAHLQRLVGPVRDFECEGIRFLEFERGRRLGRITHEFFPHDVQASTVLKLVDQLGPDQPHMISVLGNAGAGEVPTYRAAGYDHWGQETMMVCDLDAPISRSGQISVHAVDDIETANRIVGAQEAAGLRAHPITGSHLDDPHVLQRWIELDSEVAAFARMVINGDIAYLADVITLLAFRRRGCGEALVRELLWEARRAGANSCVLASTAMAEHLYRSAGFEDLLPLTGFETRMSTPHQTPVTQS